MILRNILLDISYNGKNYYGWQKQKNKPTVQQTIEDSLKLSLKILKKHGRVAIMSYHSLEDRIVKRFINEMATGCTCPKDFPKCVCGKVPTVKKITKKPIIASDEEIKNNPRARSAKLRVFELI